MEISANKGPEISSLIAANNAKNIEQISAVKEEPAKLPSKQLNKQSNLSIEYNKDIGQIVMQIKDPETKEIIRQVPSDEIIGVIEDIKRFQKEGYFVSEVA